jgi:hypothetical protein
MLVQHTADELRGSQPWLAPDRKHLDKRTNVAVDQKAHNDAIERVIEVDAEFLRNQQRRASPG